MVVPGKNARLSTLLLLAAHSTTGSGNNMPLGFEVCIDFHCDLQRAVTLSQDQWQSLEALLSESRTPAIERERIGKAIALFEVMVGEQAGTDVDLSRNGFGEDPGQLDCISESLNTTTYLRLLADRDLLKWHRVETRKRRRLWFFSIHWTAVIKDNTDSQKYAVDSWYFKNGSPPVIQPLEHWIMGRDFKQN
jgi:hypothetical protein